MGKLYVGKVCRFILTLAQTGYVQASMCLVVLLESTFCNINIAWNFYATAQHSPKICAVSQTNRRGDEAAWATWPFQGTRRMSGPEVLADFREVRTQNDDG